MKKRIRIFICHWSDSYRRALKYALERMGDKIEIIGEGQEFADCYEWMDNQGQSTDMVIISFRAYMRNSFEVVKNIASEFPKTKVLTMSVFELDELGKVYKLAGACDHYGGSADIQKLFDLIVNQYDNKKRITI